MKTHYLVEVVLKTAQIYRSVTGSLGVLFMLGLMMEVCAMIVRKSENNIFILNIVGQWLIEVCKTSFRNPFTYYNV
jgi:hypothetical protein